jgi:hypothetical protein
MVSQAFSLDGVNDFINVPDVASLDITEALSIDLWMKAPPVTNDQGAEIVDKGDYAFVGGAYTLRISAIYSGDIPNAGPNLAGRVNFVIWIGEPSTYPNDTWHINSQSRVDDDAWHFIAATYDGAAMKLYVDGVLETTFSVSGNVRPTDLDLRLGCNSYTGGGCFRGLIDEVEIFDRALSAGEVEALYSAGSAGKIKPGWRSSYIVPEEYPVVDFAVYDGSLYAAADNKLYVKDGSSWNVIDAPTFVTSLEPYGDTLVAGGKGGLYCYDGTSFSLIFSVPTYIKVLGAYNNTLYAGTMLDDPPKLYYCNGSAENPADWHIDTGFSAILNFSGAFGSIDSFWASNNSMGAPVGYWKFDEGAGSVAFDSSGNNFDGTVNGANWTEGILNKALDFDGQDDYVEVLDSTELNPPAITVAAWVNFKGFPEPGENGWRNSVIASKGTDVLVDGNYVLFTCAQFVDGAHMYFQITEQGQYTYVGGNTIIVEDEWYYAVGTYDGSVLRVYVNGVLDGEAVLNTQRTSNTENLQIGAMRMLGNGYWTNGTIDEVKIYGYAKTPEEIWNDYFSGVGKMYVASGNSVYCYDGANWSVVVSYDDVSAFLAMKAYDGKLYLATRDQGWRKPLYQGGTGFSGRVIEFDGENWTTVLDHDYWIYSLETYDNKLYAGTANKILTYNGTHWETSFNATEGAYYAIAMINYEGKIYAGMGNGYIFADPAPAKAKPETIVVPEFSSNTILAVFMALTILATALTRKNRTKRFD